MSARPAGELTLQTIAMPADTNANGDIFGGWLMAQLDLGCSVLARKRARGPVATVIAERITFTRPVHVGDIVSIHAAIVSEGRTSMVIAAEAWVRRMPQDVQLQVSEARFVFVAIDPGGGKRPLPMVEESP